MCCQRYICYTPGVWIYNIYSTIVRNPDLVLEISAYVHDYIIWYQTRVFTCRKIDEGIFFSVVETERAATCCHPQVSFMVLVKGKNFICLQVCRIVGFV